MFSHAMTPSEAVMDNDNMQPTGPVPGPKKALRMPVDTYPSSDPVAHGIPHDTRCVQPSLLGPHAMQAEMEEPREGEGGQLGLMMGNQQNPMMDFTLNSSLSRGAGEGNPPQFESSVYDSMMNDGAGNEAFIDDGPNLIAVMAHQEESHEGGVPSMDGMDSEENSEENRIMVEMGVEG